MNIETKKLFDLQSDILSNHILLKLLQFFASEKSTTQLYTTLAPIKEVTKNELIAANQPVPSVYYYSVVITLNRPFINFTMENEGHTPIEFYHVKLISKYPTVNFLTSIAQHLVKLFRPCPSKIDERIREISARYNSYFRYYEILSIWNEGLSRHMIKMKQPQPRLVEVEKQIIEDTAKLKTDYQIFTKLLSDIYKKQDLTKYINEQKTYELSASITQATSISMKITSITTGKTQLKVIPIERFHPSKPAFNKTDMISREIRGCIMPYLAKK